MIIKKPKAGAGTGAAQCIDLEQLGLELGLELELDQTPN
jgi:hypothetical protein